MKSSKLTDERRDILTDERKLESAFFLATHLCEIPRGLCRMVRKLLIHRMLVKCWYLFKVSDIIHSYVMTMITYRFIVLIL